CVQGKDYPLTF
nr:immunoglobulin light chain junction region [Macaca mulatta]